MRIGKIFLLLTFLPLVAFGQYGYITGNISDRFGPLNNVAITIKGTSYATYTDANGYFAFEIDTGYHELRLELTGYHPVDQTIRLDNLEQEDLDLSLESNLIDADVSIGSKTTVSQNQLESPVPIDVIYGKDLLSSGQTDLASALHQLLPSFYSVKQSVDDGINHVDPISLRGLGPDQVLVLINGKRRHKSAFLNTQDVFGKGTAGTDLNTIPLLAVDRIEVLRDGASSQYGSDAISGVINIVLKEQSQTPEVSAYSGISQEEDGEALGIGINYGFKLKGTGFVNLTAEYLDQGSVNRAGSYTGSVFGDLRDDIADSVQQFYTDIKRTDREIVELGQSAYNNGSFLLNSAFQINDKLDFYAFGGLNHREGQVRATYRLPHQYELISFFWNENGVGPKVINEITDQFINMGLRGQLSEWFLDASYGRGQNTFEVTVEDSNNASLGFFTPFTAFSGGYQYKHDVINLEASRIYHLPVGELDVAFGGEYRIERYDLIPGVEESYLNGEDTTFFGAPKAAGIQGYFGISEENALSESRSNVSGYLELDYSLGNFLVSGAVRAEEYSDFGGTNNYKIAARYKFANQFILRGSFNTGFKAPTLHQIYYRRTSSQFIDGFFQDVTHVNTQTPVLGNLLSTDVGLEPETAESFSVGFTSSINRNISLSVDAYQTEISDRIGLVNRLEAADEELQFIFAVSGVSSPFIEFFANLVDTRTRGLDAVLAAQYYGANVAYNFNSSFSYNETKVTDIPEEAEDPMIREEESRIETFVPLYQWRNNFSTTIKGVTLTLNHTRFGQTEFLHLNDADPADWVIDETTDNPASRDQQFGAKDLFSGDLTFRIFSKVQLTLGVQNITNQYPDKWRHSDNIRNGVYTYSQKVRPFDLRGTYYYTKVNFRF